MTKTTSAKVSVPERTRRSQSSSQGHSSSEDDSKAHSSSSGTKDTLSVLTYVTTLNITIYIDIDTAEI